MTFRKTIALLAVALAAITSPLQATTRATDYPGSVSILLGIDERTAALVTGDLSRRPWSVAGQGCLTVYRGSIAARYVPGAQLRL